VYILPEPSWYMYIHVSKKPEAKVTNQHPKIECQLYVGRLQCLVTHKVLLH